MDPLELIGKAEGTFENPYSLRIPIVNSNAAFDEGDTTLTDGSRLTTDRPSGWIEAPRKERSGSRRTETRQEADLAKMKNGREGEELQTAILMTFCQA